jgi:hypothetical protein
MSSAMAIDLTGWHQRKPHSPRITQLTSSMLLHQIAAALSSQLGYAVTKFTVESYATQVVSAFNLDGIGLSV